MLVIVGREREIKILNDMFHKNKQKRLTLVLPVPFLPNLLLLSNDSPLQLVVEIERGLINTRTGPLSFHHLAQYNQTDNNTTNQHQTTTHLPLNDAMFHHISKVVASTNGRVEGSDGAAEILKINPSTLRKKMNKLGIAYGRKY